MEHYHDVLLIENHRAGFSTYNIVTRWHMDDDPPRRRDYVVYQEGVEEPVAVGWSLSEAFGAITAREVSKVIEATAPTPGRIR